MSQDLKIGDFAHYADGSLVRIIGLQPKDSKWEPVWYKCYFIFRADLSEPKGKRISANIRPRNLTKINIHDYISNLEKVKQILLEEEKKPV